MLGRHTLEADTREQGVVAESRSMTCDLGFAVKRVLNVDAEALERIQQQNSDCEALSHVGVREHG